MSAKDWNLNPERMKYHQDYIPPTWTSGFGNVKTNNILQSLFFNETSHLNRRNYDLSAHMFRQINQSRARHKPQERTTENFGNMAVKRKSGEARYPGSMKKGKKDATSQHISLSSTSASGNFLAVSEDRILWRHGGKSSKHITFTQLEPDIHRTFRSRFKVTTEGSGKFGEDWGIHCPALNGSEDLLLPNQLTPKIFSLPKGGRRLCMYDNETGKFQQELFFQGTTAYSKVDCDEERIICQSKLNSLPRGVAYEFLILKYPPLRVEARVQVLTPPQDCKGQAPSKFEIIGDYLVGFCASSRIELYDLENVMQWTKLDAPSQHDGPLPITHVVRFLPKPLLSVKSLESFITLYDFLPAYCVIKTSQGFKVFEITPSGMVDVESSDLLNFDNARDREDSLSFMEEAPPRIIWKSRDSLRIFQICRLEKKGEDIPYLKLLLDFNTRLDQVHEVQRQDRLRVVNRCKYNLDDTTVAFGENRFLQQIAIIKFADKSFKVYVYDTLHFKLQYSISVPHFSAKEDDICDSIDVHFNRSFIALCRRGSGTTTVYLVGLCRSLD